MRPLSVLIPLCLAVTTAVIGLACTEGSVDPDSFELEEDTPSFEAHAGFEHQPEAATVIDPSSQPRLQFDPITRRALVSYSYNTGGCLSDEATYVSTIELSPAVIDAIERNPTATFAEEQRRFEVLDYP